MNFHCWWVAVSFLLLKITLAEVISSAENNTACGNITCFNNGKCKDNKACMCQKGYTGKTCSDDMDECHMGDPCYHRGYCNNSIGSYTCDCLDGWFGIEHCEYMDNSTDIHLCTPRWMGEWCADLCLNDTMCGKNRVCKMRGRGLKCACDVGWTGRNCTKDVDECPGNPCKHSGSCVNTVGSYTCTCPVEWQGNDCEEDVNECLNDPCQNSGTCVNTNGSYSCKCAPGWRDKNCTETDWCVNTPCKNSATCTNARDTYQCACTSGWKGFNCTDDIDECVSNPCVNAVSCNNTDGSYICACVQGWQGENCIYKDSCLYSPCENTGTCINVRDAYQCKCASGWKGVNCTDDVDECTFTTSCKHQGNCSNTLGSYMCNCSMGWQGDVCDVDTNECLTSPCNTSYTCRNTNGSFLCEPAKSGSSASSKFSPKAGVIAAAVIGLIVVIGCLAIVLLVLKHKIWNKRSVSDKRKQDTCEERKEPGIQLQNRK